MTSASRACYYSVGVFNAFAGGIEISFKVTGLAEIQQWVLSMGPEAVVVEPEELKISVWKSLKEGIGQYGGISDNEIDAMVFESQASFAWL